MEHAGGRREAGARCGGDGSATAARRRGLALATGLLAVVVAQAQVAPPPASGGRVDTPAAVPLPSELAPPRVPRGPSGELPARPVPRELAKPQDDITIDVRAFAVDDDAPAALKAALPALTAPYVGAGRGYEDLANAAAEVTRFLQRDLGYYLGYAYLPAQSPQDGVVRIAVLEGRLDRVELNWRDDLPVRREVVEAYLARLQPGSVLQVRDVERVVFLVNDLRGLNARFEVKAGREPGTAALVVTPAPEPRWSGKVDLDLNGSRFLGTERLGGVVGYASPFGRGDGLTATALTSFNGGLRFALLGYVTPVGSDGLKLGATVSAVQYQLDRKTFDLDLNGSATNLTGYALYPWVRSRNLNLFGLASAELKKYTDRRDVTQSVERKTVRSLTLGVTGDFRDSLLTGGVNTYEANLALGRFSQDFFAGTGAPERRYTKATLALNRLQNLVDNRLLLYLAGRLQWTADRLDTTEQFRLGGPDGVRAFAPGEATGDRGTLLTAELRLLPPESWLGQHAREFVFGLFYDVGHRSVPDDAKDESRVFSGAGVSLAWERPREWALRASLASPISGHPRGDPKVRDPRLYLQLTRLF